MKSAGTCRDFLSVDSRGAYRGKVVFRMILTTAVAGPAWLAAYAHKTIFGAI